MVLITILLVFVAEDECLILMKVHCSRCVFPINFYLNTIECTCRVFMFDLPLIKVLLGLIFLFLRCVSAFKFLGFCETR